MRADEIDERIDAALRSYADPVETPEPRVVLAWLLERAQADKAARRRRWLGLIPAVGSAAAMLAAAVWVLRVPATPEIAWTPKAPGVVSVSTAPERVPARAVAAHISRNPQVQAAAEALPKLEVFPAPMPLAEEEQKLVAFTRQTPPAVVHQVIDEKQHLDDPLEIAELKIKPLDASDNPVPPKGKEK